MCFASLLPAGVRAGESITIRLICCASATMIIPGERNGTTPHRLGEHGRLTPKTNVEQLSGPASPSLVLARSSVVDAATMVLELTRPLVFGLPCSAPPRSCPVGKAKPCLALPRPSRVETGNGGNAAPGAPKVPKAIPTQQQQSVCGRRAATCAESPGTAPWPRPRLRLGANSAPPSFGSRQQPTPANSRRM